jgi:hypothetical protein
MRLARCRWALVDVVLMLDDILGRIERFFCGKEGSETETETESESET